MTTFSHSGTFGDIIYAMSLTKHLGGGDFYLRLNNIDNMAKHVFGPNASAGDHSGEMTKKQFDSLTEFMEFQPYINSWRVWNGEKIDYALEFAGPEIVKQQGNYAWANARANGVDPDKHYKEFMLDPWIEVDKAIKVKGRPVVVNRVNRHLYGCQMVDETWVDMFDRGLADVGIYVGMEHEHAWFQDVFKIKIPHYKTDNVMDVARVIAGAEQFIGSQSMCLSLAIGLGKTFLCESRKDLPLERNECCYVRPNGFYF
jgi:hypothetical protein